MTWWHYLLLSNLYLILFYGFYALLLQRETFFQLNRIYLVGSAVISFLIPVIQLDIVKQWFITQKVQQTIYSTGPQMVVRLQTVQPDPVTLGEVLGGIYIAGMVILTVKLLLQLFKLSRMVRRGGQYEAAWSFFKKINVDSKLDSHQVIMAHEEVHARQWHSADVLLLELVMITNWFNPVVYLYRRSIKHLHEFIADRDALKTGTSKAEYAMLLLSQTFNAPAHHLLNPFFNGSMLKKRIMMMQKNKSHYTALIKYGFSAPLFALMLALSSATLNNSKVITIIHRQAEQVFATQATAINTLAGKPVPPVANAVTTAPPEELIAAAPATLSTIRNQTLSLNAPIIVHQDSATQADPIEIKEVFTSAEKLPQFAGGAAAFRAYLAKALHLPAESAAGRAIVTFIIEKDGSVSDVRALNNPGSGIAEEAVRAIAASPKWVPGEQNGHKVRVQYTVPVQLTQDEPVSSINDTVSGKQAQAFLQFRRALPALPKSGADSAGGPKRVVMVNYQFRAHTDAPGKKPLIIIDGHEAPPGTLLSKLNVNKIEKIDIYKKDSPNTSQYGDKSKDGVIVIATKP